MPTEQGRDNYDHHLFPQVPPLLRPGRGQQRPALSLASLHLLRLAARYAGHKKEGSGMKFIIFQAIMFGWFARSAIGNATNGNTPALYWAIGMAVLAAAGLAAGMERYKKEQA